MPHTAHPLYRPPKQRTIRETENHSNRKLLFPKDQAMKKVPVCDCGQGVSRRKMLQGSLAAAAAVTAMGGVSDALLAQPEPSSEPSAPAASKKTGARAIDIHAHY